MLQNKTVTLRIPKLELEILKILYGENDVEGAAVKLIREKCFLDISQESICAKV